MARTKFIPSSMAAPQAKTTAANDRQKALQAFIKRRHPEYCEMYPQWEFFEDTYEGGRGWFEGNIFRYIKEGDQEFADRLARTYRFNHTREVVDLVDKYLFKMDIVRNEEDAPDSVKTFWKNATLNGLDIHQFAKRVSNRASVFGRVWVVIDNNAPAEMKNKADEKQAGARTYAYMVNPQYALDMGYDEFGELNWILIEEQVRDDVDPIMATGAMSPRYRLWTREFSQVFTLKGSGENQKVVEGPQKPHGLGIVPVFAADNTLSEELYESQSMIADVAYLDRAAANYLSNLDAIIQDQSYSQLAIPAQGLMPGASEDDITLKKIVEMGTKRIFTYNGEGTAAPFFLSPDPRQAQIILSVVTKIVGEIYHSIGLAGERTKDDNGAGIDNSSGVAKAYDFERVNALLVAKADSMQNIENWLVWYVAKWHSEEKKIEALERELVAYPREFDIRSLYNEFDIAARLSLIEAPDLVRRTQMETLIDKLFPQIKKDLRAKMVAELDSWPPEIIDPSLSTQTTGIAGGSGAIRKKGASALAASMTAPK